MPPVARAITSTDAEHILNDPRRTALQFCGVADGRISAGGNAFRARLPISLLRHVDKRNVDSAWMIGLRSMES